MRPMASVPAPDAGDPTAPGRELTTYPQLLTLAHEADLSQVKTQLIQTPADENGHLAIVKAEVTTARGEDPARRPAPFADC